MNISIVCIILVDLKFDIIKDRIYDLNIDKKLIITLTLFLLVILFGVYGLDFIKSNFIYSGF